jgi:tape measure domain-containing protein
MPGILYTLGIDPRQGIGGLNAMRAAVGGFTSMVGRLGPLIGFAGGIGLASAAVMGFKKSIAEAADMETMETSFQVLLGTAAKARAMLEDIKSFAAASPMDMPGIADAARTLLNFNTAADEVMPILHQLGDISGGDSERFRSLALVFGQVSSAGKLAGQDLLQFINAGFNPLLQISKSTGESMASLRKRMEEGRIGISDVRAAMQAATGAGGQFSGMMDKQSQTWNGQISTLTDNVNALFREFGKPVMETIKPFLTEAIGMADTMAVRAREWGTAVATAITMVRTAWSGGSLGELAGLSLTVGFATAIKFLATELGGVLETLQGGANGIFSGVGEIFRGAGLVLQASISDGINNALSNVKILGGSILDADRAALNRNVAAGNRTEGVALMRNGSATLQGGGGIAGQFGAFVKGINTDLTTARAQLSKAWTDAGKDMLGPSKQDFEDWRNQAQAALASPVAAAPASAAMQKIEPLSDRLAKIGGFLGGSGGNRGEKAADDTARNTGLIARGMADLNRAFDQFARATQGGTF